MKLYLYLYIFIILTSCVTDKNTMTVSGTFSKKKGVGANASTLATVTTITHVNDEITVNGANFDGTTSVTLDGQVLNILSNTAGQLVLKAAANIAITFGAAMNLIITNAAGAAPVNIVFNPIANSITSTHINDGEIATIDLADASVTAAKLNSMGASNGQVLKYSGGAWTPSDLNSLVYSGTWDAGTCAVPSVSPSGGDYFIITNASGACDPGDGNTRAWVVNDWVIYNSVTSVWDQVSNSSDVISFKGRSGVVVPAANDYTIDMIGSGAGLYFSYAPNNVACADTEVLKWDAANSRWDCAADTDTDTTLSGATAAGDLAGTYPNPTIKAQAVEDTMMKGVAANCSNGQVLKADGSGGFTCAADAGAGGADASSFMGESLDAGLAAATTTAGQILVWSGTQWEVGSKTVDTTIPDTNAGTICTAGQYLDGDATCKAIPAGTITGSGTDNLVPLFNTTTGIDASTVTGAELETLSGVAATLTSGELNFVDGVTSGIQTQINNITSVSADYIEHDGSVDITGSLKFKKFGSIYEESGAGTETITVKAPAAIGTSYDFILPDTAGNNNQVLETDGSGNLSWVNNAGGTGDFLADGSIAMTGDLKLNTSKLVGNGGTDGISITSSGNVGIGKTGASVKLELGAADNNDISAKFSTTNTGSSTAFELKTESNTGRVIFQSDSLTNGTDRGFKFISGVIDSFMITKDGNTIIGDGGTLATTMSLSVKSITQDSTLSNFTQSLTKAGLNIESDYVVSSYTPGVFWSSSNNNPTKPKAGIWLFEDGNGIDMYFGTSNNFTTGITNNGLVIDENGKIGISTVLPDSILTLNSSGLDINQANSVGQGALVIEDNSGDSSGYKLRLDSNEIQISNNGTATNFAINPFGGNVSLGDNNSTLNIATSNIIFNQGTGSTGLGPDILFGVSGLIAAENSMHFNIDSDNDTTTAGFTFSKDSASTVGEIELMRINEDGNVGIGTAAPAQKLDVNGNIAVAGTTVHTSDIRLKEKISKITDSLDKILQLNGVEYFWKNRNKDPHKQIGVIAQNIKAVFPELVYKNKVTGYFSVNYAGLVAPLIEATKEQQQFIISQNIKIAKLSSNNDTLILENANIQLELVHMKNENAKIIERLLLIESKLIKK